MKSFSLIYGGENELEVNIWKEIILSFLFARFHSFKSESFFLSSDHNSVRSIKSIDELNGREKLFVDGEVKNIRLS